MKVLTAIANPSLRLRTLPDGDDTGARIPQGATVRAFGESFDQKWTFVTFGEYDGWVSSQFLRNVVLPETPKVPHGIAEIRATFGEPGSPPCHAGRVNLPAPIRLSWADESVTVFACHAKLEAVFEAVFAEIHAKGYWPMLEDFGGCYNDRRKRGSSKVSTHSWGIAVDLNTKTNPMGKRGKMPRVIVEIFEAHGFQWGGDWSRPDPMHFQYCTGY